jgi:hypothetical protein
VCLHLLFQSGILLSGHSDANALLELLLTYKVLVYVFLLLNSSYDAYATWWQGLHVTIGYVKMQTLGDDAAVGNCSTSGFIPQSTEDDDDDLDSEYWEGDDDADGSDGSSDEVDDSLSLFQ